MAGAQLNLTRIPPIENSRPSIENLASKATPVAFLGCSKLEIGTISAAIRQLLPESSAK
jgi:hypothetical protein